MRKEIFTCVLFLFFVVLLTSNSFAQVPLLGEVRPQIVVEGQWGQMTEHLVSTTRDFSFGVNPEEWDIGWINVTDASGKKAKGALIMRNGIGQECSGFSVILRERNDVSVSFAIKAKTTGLIDIQYDFGVPGKRLKGFWRYNSVSSLPPPPPSLPPGVPGVGAPPASLKIISSPVMEASSDGPPKDQDNEHDPSHLLHAVTTAWGKIKTNK